MSPSEMDKMYWYDIEFLVKRLQKQLEAEQEEGDSIKAEQDDAVRQYKQDMNIPNLNDVKIPNMPSLPNMPNFDSLFKNY